MEKLFRELRADEIDARVNTLNEYGASLLLYKDARVDMNLLDEAFTPFGWMRRHEVIDGRLYCTVSIKDPETGVWVEKQDVGTESDTEKEKGQASDSFKRACFNWGIGRELYTAPFVWLPKEKYTEKKNKAGKPTTYDKFRVSKIEYEDGKITALEIVNDSRKGEVVYTFGNVRRRAEKPKGYKDMPVAEKEATNASESPQPPSITDRIGSNEWNEIKAACKAVGMNEAELLERYQVSKPSEITFGMRDDMISFLAKG